MFWKQGCDDTSVQELERATITRRIDDLMRMLRQHQGLGGTNSPSILLDNELLALRTDRFCQW